MFSIQVVSISNSAGTLKNRAVTLSHLRRCQCAIFMVNLNEKSSFDIAKYLYEEYRQNWSGLYKHNCLLLANHTESEKRLPSPVSGVYEHDRIETRGGVNQVSEFCRANNIDYREVNVKNHSVQVTEAINNFLLKFTKENYNTLHAEKKNVEPDTGSSCSMI
jgi:GTPase involved in cell partitioning and DNA repair